VANPFSIHTCMDRCCAEEEVFERDMVEVKIQLYFTSRERGFTTS